MLWLTIALSFLASLLAAIVVRTHLHERLAIIGSFVGLEPSYNPGIAFGVRLPPFFQELLILTALVLVTIGAVRSAKTVWQRLAFGLIVGGALGNLADRAINGTVMDFIQVGNFYIFNLADSCISVGVALLLLESILGMRKKQLPIDE